MRNEFEISGDFSILTNQIFGIYSETSDIFRQTDILKMFFKACLN